MFEPSFLLLAQDAGHASAPWWSFLMNPAVVWILVPVVAIIMGVFASIIKRSQEHRERMALISAGFHPDYPPEEEGDEYDRAAYRQTADHSRR